MSNQNDKNQDKNQDKSFPGYPSHPASEDITNREQEVRKQAVNTENLSQDEDAQGREQRGVKLPDAKNAGAENEDTDITPEDMAALSASFQNRDMADRDPEENILDERDNDGDPLNETEGHYGKTGLDLDVPGSELDDRDEKAGEEDEENNYYSLGGDNHEDLEEDQS